ncbi:MAG: hypothetical protein PGN13_08145, partial [Patulibacter minatonensis]
MALAPAPSVAPGIVRGVNTPRMLDAVRSSWPRHVPMKPSSAPVSRTSWATARCTLARPDCSRSTSPALRIAIAQVCWREVCVGSTVGAGSSPSCISTTIGSDWVVAVAGSRHASERRVVGNVPSQSVCSITSASSPPGEQLLELRDRAGAELRDGLEELLAHLHRLGCLRGDAVGPRDGERGWAGDGDRRGGRIVEAGAQRRGDRLVLGERLERGDRVGERHPLLDEPGDGEHAAHVGRAVAPHAVRRAHGHRESVAALPGAQPLAADAA